MRRPAAETERRMTLGDLTRIGELMNAGRMDDANALIQSVYQPRLDQRAALLTRAAELAQELRNIAEAHRFDRGRFLDDTDFADWAQNRARAALEAANGNAD